MRTDTHRGDHVRTQGADGVYTPRSEAAGETHLPAPGSRTPASGTASCFVTDSLPPPAQGGQGEGLSDQHALQPPQSTPWTHIAGTTDLTNPFPSQLQNGAQIKVTQPARNKSSGLSPGKPEAYQTLGRSKGHAPGVFNSLKD